MATIAIVDDNPCDRDVLASYLRRGAESGDFASVGPDDLRVLSYASGRDYLDAQPDGADVVLLDIEMSPMNGIECARRIRETNRDLVIVFVTNLFQFALEGYEVQALDFLVKPVRYQGFVATISRAFQMLESRGPHFVSLDFGRSQSMIDVSSITYVETQRKRLVVHTSSGTTSCTSSLKDLAFRLEPLGFAMPHQSFLVNLAHVERVGTAELTVAGEIVPLSRYKRAAFMQAFASFAGRTV